jgi:hypothetical protein
MDNIFNFIICCKSSEIPKKSEVNINTNYSAENINSTINNTKLEDKEKERDKEREKEKDKKEKEIEKDKSERSSVKNESSNIKSLESNILNENISENSSSHNPNKSKEGKKEKLNSKNSKECQRSSKKNKSKKDNKDKSNKELKLPKEMNKDNITVEEQNKILANIKLYKLSGRKILREPPIHKDSVLTLNDLVVNVKSQEEKLEHGSKLLLSGELFFDKELIIQTNGLVNSMRKVKDEHVFFGIKCKLNASSCFAYNDIIINYFYPIEEEETIETNTGRIFEIFYNKTSKDYSLKFLHPNLILYYKINNFVYFNTGKEYYLLLGNVFMTINVVKNSPMEKTIIIQIEIENTKPKSYTFNQSQTPIKIGRTNNNELPIYSQSISKRHGLIEFSNNIQSFYYRDLGSTNSSTLLIKDGDNLKIKGIMNFKLEDTPFRVQEIP